MPRLDGKTLEIDVLVTNNNHVLVLRNSDFLA